MNIIVLVKQVPDTAQLSQTVDALTLLKGEGNKIVNPSDEYALEAGLQLKEAHGGKVTALSMGKPEAVEALRRGLAMGVDEAILVSDPALQNSDTLATARALVAAIKKIGEYDLILAGRAGVDRNMSTAVQVAALLGIPQISYVAAIKGAEPQAGKITTVRLMERGRETVSAKLPALISVIKEINEPRYPSFMGVRKASKVKVPIWELADLGLESDQVGQAGSQVSWPEVSLPPARETAVEMISGSPAEAAKTLVEKLVEEKVI